MEKKGTGKLVGMRKAALACAVGAGLLLFAAGTVNAGMSYADTTTLKTDGQPTYEQLQALYPNEFNSAMEHKADEEGEDNSHAGFQDLMETPAQRDVSGAIIRVVDPSDPDYTPVALKCVSCKSSRFVDLYNINGAQAFSTMTLDEDAEEFLDGQYWDCYGCHAADESGNWTVQPSCAYADSTIFPKVAATLEQADLGVQVCAQCHNTASARSSVQSAEDAAEFDPYKYGTSMDGIYLSLVERGAYSTDEATGMKLVSMNHPQFEIFQGSAMQSVGLTCVDCHMPETTDESGELYTMHSASSSVAGNDVAMEKCLTCHENMSGVDTVEDMRAFLEDRQEAQLERQQEVEQKLDQLYNLIVAAQERPETDADVLMTAKSNYELAYFLDKEQQQNLFDPADGAQISHNPQLMEQMLERADALLSSSIEALA